MSRQQPQNGGGGAYSSYSTDYYGSYHGGGGGGNHHQQQQQPPVSYATYGAGAYGAYGAYGGAAGGGGGGGGPVSPTLRRRGVQQSMGGSNGRSPSSSKGSRSMASNMKKLDFMFPKVDQEYTIQTDNGGIVSVIAYVLIVILCIAEIQSWYIQNEQTVEHISVDTRLGMRMDVNLNITFPGLACIDLHMDVMDVAGDSQLNLEDSMVKRRLNRRGKPISIEEKVESNAHRIQQEERDNILLKGLPDDYCGPCYGAHENDEDCCNTCDDVVAAYDKKKWRTDQVLVLSEQCIREGRDKKQPKRMTKGEGCNLSGTLTVNRVAGNFHIAMGEGIERDGRHIHTFVPEDTPNFNASHIIHSLSFTVPKEQQQQQQQDSDDDNDNNDDNEVVGMYFSNAQAESESLNGVTKIVTHEYGTTGLFQYFIKVVPTTYVHPTTAKNTQKKTNNNKKQSSSSSSSSSRKVTTTNRYFFTERFRPLMKEYLPEELPDDDDDNIDDDDDDGDYHGGGYHDDDGMAYQRRRMEKKNKLKDEKKKKKQQQAEVSAGTSSSKHSAAKHDEHHHVKNSVLPGIFFVYEIYPFNVEISRQTVPYTHLLIRLMATIGGVMTLIRITDGILFSTSKKSISRR